MLEQIFSISMLINIAALLYFIGFMVRDELILRLLILAGTILYLIYYFYFPEGPLWNAIITSAILGLANVWVLAKIVFERTTLALTEDEKTLYENLDNLNPGQFRKIMKHAKWHHLEETTTICEQDEKADKLFYILRGHVEVSKNGKQFCMDNRNFIGEVAFTLNSTYSATVRALPSACYVEWKNNELEKLMKNNNELSNAIVALFNKDLARKLSLSYQ